MGLETTRTSYKIIIYSARQSCIANVCYSIFVIAMVNFEILATTDLTLQETHWESEVPILIFHSMC